MVVFSGAIVELDDDVVTAVVVDAGVVPVVVVSLV